MGLVEAPAVVTEDIPAMSVPELRPRPLAFQFIILPWIELAGVAAEFWTYNGKRLVRIWAAMTDILQI
jgi:hypothetical protein